jgi:hypothetical protein
VRPRTGVPQLKPNGPVLQIHGLGEEIDSNGGLTQRGKGEGKGYDAHIEELIVRFLFWSKKEKQDRQC